MIGGGSSGRPGRPHSAGELRPLSGVCAQGGAAPLPNAAGRPAKRPAARPTAVRAAGLRWAGLGCAGLRWAGLSPPGQPASQPAPLADTAGLARPNQSRAKSAFSDQCSTYLIQMQGYSGIMISLVVLMLVTHILFHYP